MPRLLFLVVGLVLLGSTSAHARPQQDTGVHMVMPPPPEDVPEDAQLGAEALERYARGRSLPRFEGGWLYQRAWYRSSWYGSSWYGSGWGWPYAGGCGWGPGWRPYGTWGVYGGYRISLSPWSYSGVRTWSGAYVCSW